MANIEIARAILHILADSLTNEQFSLDNDEARYALAQCVLHCRQLITTESSENQPF